MWACVRISPHEGTITEVMMARRPFGFIRAMAALALVRTAFLPFASARAQSRVQGWEVDSKAIKQAFADFYEAFSRDDAHAVAMTFAEGADLTHMAGGR